MSAHISNACFRSNTDSKALDMLVALFVVSTCKFWRTFAASGDQRLLIKPLTPRHHEAKGSSAAQVTATKVK